MQKYIIYNKVLKNFLYIPFSVVRMKINDSSLWTKLSIEQFLIQQWRLVKLLYVHFSDLLNVDVLYLK